LRVPGREIVVFVDLRNVLAHLFHEAPERGLGACTSRSSLKNTRSWVR
jgi:hypothetical protein